MCSTIGHARFGPKASVRAGKSTAIGSLDRSRRLAELETLIFMNHKFNTKTPRRCWMKFSEKIGS